MAISAEFDLVARCCGWPHDAGRLDRVRGRAAAVSDWQRVLAITRRHRVGGLVSHAVLASGAALPPDVRGVLADVGRTAAISGMRQAAAAIDLVGAIAAAGVAASVIKGAPLAMLAYRTLGIKTAHDIDILVPPADVTRACRAIEAIGYRRYNPPPDEVSDDQLGAWFGSAIEGSWHHPGTDTIVEIHNRLCGHPAFDAVVSAHSPMQTISLGATGSVATLDDATLYTYLCIHGATHGWRRLKWLADVAAFARRDDIDPRALHAAATAAGAGRCSGQAALLSARLLGVAGWVPASDLKSPSVRLLARAAQSAIVGRDEATDDPGPLGEPLGVIASRFWLARGLAFKRAELALRLRHPTDRARSAAASDRGYIAIAMRRLVRRALRIVTRRQ